MALINKLFESFNLNKLFLGMTSLLFSSVLMAEPSASFFLLQPVPQIIDPDFLVSGYVDASYNYLLRSNHFISNPFLNDQYDRVYDLANNGWTLQQASLALSKQMGHGFGVYLNAILGRDANTIAPSGFDANVFDVQNAGLAISQAYLQYATGSFIVNLGQFTSLSGLEQINYQLDTNFSRSILFGYAEPGTHVGLRVVDNITPEWSVIAGLNNGWDTIRRATSLNTAELGLAYYVSPTLSVLLDGYAGKQYLTNNAQSGPTSERYLIDFFVIWNVLEKLSLAMNYDYGWQPNALLPNGAVHRANWQGIATYLNYFWNEKWYSSLRGELFADSDGYRTGVKQNWRELTLTFGFVPIKNLQFHLETRHDFSNVNSFLDKNGISTSNNQQSYALETLYTFF